MCGHILIFTFSVTEFGLEMTTPVVFSNVFPQHRVFSNVFPRVLAFYTKMGTNGFAGCKSIKMCVQSDREHT